jgi:hypothetical protein
MSREYGFGTGCFDSLEEAREFAGVVAERDGVGFIYTIPLAGRPLFSVTYSPPGQVRADFVERVIS